MRRSVRYIRSLDRMPLLSRRENAKAKGTSQAVPGGKRVQRLWRKEGLRVPAASESAPGLATTATASGCGQSAPTTSGRSTSRPTKRLTAVSYQC